jgi:phasin family protein
MTDAKRMADEATKMGEEVQERGQRMGREYQRAAESGFEAASRSFNEANKGFQALASEMTDFSKRGFEDVFLAWKQLLRARDVGDVVQAQTQYAQRAFDAYTSELTKIGEMCGDMVRDASKPVEDASKKFR